MIKLSLLISLTVLFRGFYINVHAQLSNPSQQHNAIVQGLLNPTFSSKNVKKQTRALSFRVIGQSTTDHLLSSLTDSVNLTYPLNGTSQYDYSMLLYAYNYPYSTTPMFNNYLGVFTKPQVLQQNFNHWTINPNTLVYGFYEKRTAGYDFGFNLTVDTSWLADSAINPNTIHENTFNLLNQIEVSYKSNYTGGSVDSAFKQFFQYNSSDQLIKDSTYQFDGSSWHLVSKTFYTYDGAGNLIIINNFGNDSDTTFTLPLVNLLKYTNTYDASNRLLTVHSDYFDGSTMMPYVKDSFAYTGTSDFHTNWKQFQYDPINAMWAPQLNMTKYLNGSGLPDSIMIDQYNFISDTWTPNYKYILTYDANENPKQLLQYIYNFTSFPSTPDFTTTYYYESFTNTTETPNPHESNIDFGIYPNPAHNQLTITRYEFSTSPIFFNILNSSCKVIGSFPLNSSTNAIDISNYAAGFYIGVFISEGQVLHSEKLVIK